MMIVNSSYPASARYSGIRRYSKIAEDYPLPGLVDVQLGSFRWFQEVGLRQLLDEISPIVSFNKNLELHFLDFRFREPRHTEEECRDRDATFASPLWVQARLINKDTGEISEQEVFLGDFPLMTARGTFIINGAERVVVSQLIRSPGVYFTLSQDRASGRQLCMAKLIPGRGAWLEFETSRRDMLSVKVDRRRKIPVTILLRAVEYGTDEELLRAFAEAEKGGLGRSYIRPTMERDGVSSREEALLDFYKRLRPGEPPTVDNAAQFIQTMLFDPRRYDLGRVGRYKLNKRLALSVPLETHTLTPQDLAKVVEVMIKINNGLKGPDDIDHLGNRRVKTVGELVQNQLRLGLLRMERVVRERMSIHDPEQQTPVALINIRPVVAAIRQFFGGSQLSQFMDQTNPLAELANKRRLSALGPGGLKRERAGFDVRDVHHSHYGRICPIETPEGPNIGLIGVLATYARVNDFGFIETLYRQVVNSVPNESQALLGRTLREAVVDPSSGEVVAQAGTVIHGDLAQRIASLPLKEVKVQPAISDEIEYLDADEEDKFFIAQASTPLNGRGELIDDRVQVRHNQQFREERAERVNFIDISPRQTVGVSAALIPFLEHDDANRALMGSNMQRQAVPLLCPQAPLVGTGMEHQVALDSKQIIVAQEGGEVISVTAEAIAIKGKSGVRIYPLAKFSRSNQSTCIDQRPRMEKGDWVERGQVIADSSSAEGGMLALGQNLLVAFMPWEAGNFEDAILISEELVRQDRLTSIHIEKHECEARDTKLGPEEITRDIPNVGEDALRDLDADGIVRIGAEVSPGDILVGKITPKGETELTPEEKLLRAIFGEKARDVKDSSLRLPHGEKGWVVDISVLTREEHQDLPVGVDKVVRVNTAERRKVTAGDKLAGRHGNKGVISKVVPLEDMPFLADGTPVDIILNPLGVPARMNIGQLLETHLGWAADYFGFEAISPVFDGANEKEIRAELARMWLASQAWRELTEGAWEWVEEMGYEPQELTDDDQVRRLYLRQVLAGEVQNLETTLTDLRSSRRAYLWHWMRERGYDVEEYFPAENTLTTPQRWEADRKVERLCWRLWLQLQGVATDTLAEEEIEGEALEFSTENGIPLPTEGKTILYDGKTGESFDQPITVGVIYMMKLAHLVEDKVHARSTGPYSLVTQQPLGGKAQFGGQRFGEMEVWALEAYGAAYALQEMLTVKSDDVSGRVKTYEAIVKGEPIPRPGVPESFNVLVKELQSLGISVEVLDREGNRLKFRRDEVETVLPRLGLGLSRTDFR